MKPLDAIQTTLLENKLDGLLISSVPNILYLTDYAGFSEIEREAYLLITKSKKYIFTDGRYTTAVKSEIPDYTLKEITGTNTFPELLHTCITKHRLKRIGFESTNLTVAEFLKIKKLPVTFVYVSLRELRMIKQQEKIKQIQKACTLGDKVYRYIQLKLRTGMHEQEVKQEMELYMMRLNVTPSFPTIVAFGENAAVPHHHTGERKLKNGDFVLLDFGVTFNNYCSDMTRTVVYGDPTTEQKRIHDIVLQAQKNATGYITSKLKKGETPTGAEADKAARSFIVSQGYPSIPHSLGHGIGIEVHEAPTLSPRSNDTLTEGMVFSIEPGIYIPDVGGVRIEDLFTIQKGKLVQLTSSPKGIDQFV